MNYESRLMDAMREKGIQPPDHIVLDDTVHRHKTTGSSQSGYYCGTVIDGVLLAWFGDWIECDNAYSFRFANGTEMSPERKKLVDDKMLRMKRAAIQKRKEHQKEMGLEAERRWDTYTKIEDDLSHEYLQRKQIKPNWMMRQHGDLLAVKVIDEMTKMTSIQYISKDGTKRFMKGGKTLGCYALAGEVRREGTLWFAEGYATGCSIAELTGETCVVTLSARNMKEVALSMREKYPVRDFKFAGDNGKLGEEMAENAAAVTGGLLAVPPDPKYSDWNDMLLAEGPDATRLALEDAMREPDLKKPISGEKDAVETPPESSQKNNVGSFNPNFPKSIANRDQILLQLFDVEPVDIFAEQEPPRFDINHAPDTLKTYARLQGQVMGVDPGAPLLSALIVASSAIHDDWEVMPNPENSRTYIVGPTLWGCIVAPPSAKKTPIISAALEPLRKVSKTQAKKFAEELAIYNDECEIIEGRRKTLKAELRKRETLDEDRKALRTEMPEHPIEDRVLFGSVTIEKLAQSLEHNRRGCLVHRDELSGWFGEMGAYSSGGDSSKDRAFWAEAYNRKDHLVDRISRGTINIERLAVNVLGGIQPGVFRSLNINRDKLGLIQRMMFCFVGPGMPSSTENVAGSEAAENAYAALIESLYQTKAGGMVRFSPAASQLMVDFENEMMAEQDGLEETLASALGKLAGLSCRIAIVYHLILAYEEGKYPSLTLSAETYAMARDFCKYSIKPSASYIASDVFGEIASADRLAVAEVLQSLEPGKHFTKTSIMKKSFRARQFGRREWSDVLSWLESLAWCKPLDDEGKVYVTNPKIAALSKR